MYVLCLTSAADCLLFCQFHINIIYLLYSAVIVVRLSLWVRWSAQIWWQSGLRKFTSADHCGAAQCWHVRRWGHTKIWLDRHVPLLPSTPDRRLPYCKSAHYPNVVLAGVPRRSSSSNLDAYYTRLIERHLLYIATIAIAGWPKNGAPVVYSSGTEMVFLPRSSNTLHR